jgi:hypothetical protein
MGKTATGGGEPRELVPARTYLGVINGVFDIGTQKGFGDRGPVNQFIITFELHTRGNRKSGPQPARDAKGHIHEISAYVSFYLGSRERPSNLLKVIEACERRQLTGDEIRKGYDIEQLLGKCCQVIVVHEAKKSASGELFAKADSFAALDPDDEEPAGELDEVYYEITEAREIPDSIPKWIAKKIRESQEFGGNVSGSTESDRQPAMAGAGASDEEIPF